MTARGKIGQNRSMRAAGSKDEALWLLSFADLSCILIAFFILMLSYAKIDTEKLEDISRGKKRPDNLQTFYDKLHQTVKSLNLEKDVTVIYDADGVTIEFKDTLLFDSGSAQANKKFAAIVDPVMKLISGTADRYHLRLEGHTDDVPITTRLFKSNWELSAARSIALINTFTTRGVQEQRISVAAFAHTRPKIPYHSLAGPELEKARAANRRVVIKIY